MKFLYAFSSLLLIASLAHGQIRIGGSDLLASEFATSLSEFAESREVDVTVEFAGSYSAMEALKAGELDLAVVAIPDGMELPGDEFRTEYIGAKVLTVVVPDTNPLSEINVQQLAGVFGEAAATNITRWGELGLTGEWSTRSILIGAVSVAEHTLANDLFRHTVLSSGKLKRTLVQDDTIDQVRARLREADNGIAMLHRVPSDLSGLKVLSIARTQADLAYSPSPETVADEDYALRLPLYLVFPKERAGELTELLRYIVSDEAADSLESHGLVPLPEVGRQRLFFEF